jgi:hypothetical protein
MTDVGPSMARGVLSGVPESCTDGPECVPLPPEQRGRISRCLADDEGDDGRFMDIPKPGGASCESGASARSAHGLAPATDAPRSAPRPKMHTSFLTTCLTEVWNGAKALTKEIFTGLVPPLHPVEVKVKEPLEPEGFELSEPGAGGPSFDTSSAREEAAAAAEAEGKERAPEMRPEGARTEAGKRPYFRQEPEGGGFAESPQALVGQMAQLAKEITTFMFPVHLFFPGGEEKEKADKAAAAARAAAAAAQAAKASAPPPHE